MTTTDRSSLTFPDERIDDTHDRPEPIALEDTRSALNGFLHMEEAVHIHTTDHRN